MNFPIVTLLFIRSGVISNSIHYNYNFIDVVSNHSSCFHRALSFYVIPVVSTFWSFIIYLHQDSCWFVIHFCLIKLQLHHQSKPLTILDRLADLTVLAKLVVSMLTLTLALTTLFVLVPKVSKFLAPMVFCSIKQPVSVIMLATCSAMFSHKYNKQPMDHP